MRFVFFIILFLFFKASFGQPCPNNLNAPNANNNPIIIYIYNSDDEIIDSTICNQAGGSGNFNCNLDNLTPDASYLSFGNINNESDLGSCIYDTNGVLIQGGALPIELFSFTVENVKNSNLINWVTSSESNNDYFLVERSVDGINWTDIKRVIGAGNSNKQLSYEIVDKNYLNTINYYRLTQVDFDGVSETFNPISVDNRNDKYLIKVINMLGQEVDEYYKGIVIHIYSDGSKVKIFQN